MAQYKNATKGVMVIGGAVVAPGTQADIDDTHPGAKRAIARGSLVKVDGRTKATKAEPKQDTKASDDKSPKAE